MRQHPARGVAAALLAGLLATSATAQDQDLRMGDDPAYFQRVELPDDGLAISVPGDWVVDAEAVYYPDEDGDGSFDRWDVLHAFEPDGARCRLTRLVHPGFELRTNAIGLADRLDERPDGGSTADWIEIDIPVGEAYRIDEVDAELGLYSAFVLFDSDASRYMLRCSAAWRDPRDWMDIAETLEWLDREAAVDEGPAVQVIDLPAAGVELALPSDWTVEPEIDELSVFLPPPYDDVGEVAVLQALAATGPGDAWCSVYAYQTMPMTLPEHAQWLASMVSGNTELPATVESESVRLPIGDSERLVESFAAGEFLVVYLFDVDGSRRYLICGDVVLPGDAWLSVAETIAPMAGPLPQLPEDAVDWSELHDIATVLPVTSAAVGETYVHARCGRATWIELADGSYQEVLACGLTDEPVEAQGKLPQERVTLEGGACEWVSDFWAAYDGSEYWAESWSVTLEPDGSATAVSRYAAEALDCGD